MINKKHIIYAGSSLVVPFVSYAWSLGVSTDSTFSSFIDEVLSVIYVIIPILSTIAFIVFFWGLSKFILNSGSKEGIEKGKDYMLWGILALFILLTVRVIIGLIATDLDIGNSDKLPYLPQDGANVTTDEDFVLPDGTHLTP